MERWWRCRWKNSGFRSMNAQSKHVTISALGPFRKYLPEKKDFYLVEELSDLGEQVEKLTGIPATEPRISYVVNGQIKKRTYVPLPGDNIVVLKMGGAG